MVAVPTTPTRVNCSANKYEHDYISSYSCVRHAGIKNVDNIRVHFASHFGNISASL